MAISSVSFNARTLTSAPSFFHSRPASTKAVNFRVRCGPRSNRGPLVKGRILSTEAILAVQSLKRLHRQSSSFSASSLPDLSRLIKSDLVAVLRELLRQDLCSVALPVLFTLRSEYHQDSVDLNLYADVINALVRNKLGDDVDRVIDDLERGESGIQWSSDRGLVRVVKGVIEGRRKESTVRIVGMMKRSGCGDTWTADDYLVRVLSNGLRVLGEPDLAGEVEEEFSRVCKGSLGRPIRQ